MGGSRSEEGLEAVLLYFIGLEFEEHRSFSSVAKSVAAIAFWLKMRGFRDVSKFFSGAQGFGWFQEARGC